MQSSMRTNFSLSALPLSEAFHLSLLDLDGVVYRGGNAVEYAVEAIECAQKAEKDNKRRKERRKKKER